MTSSLFFFYSSLFAHLWVIVEVLLVMTFFAFLPPFSAKLFFCVVVVVVWFFIPVSVLPLDHAEFAELDEVELKSAWFKSSKLMPSFFALVRDRSSSFRHRSSRSRSRFRSLLRKKRAKLYNLYVYIKLHNSLCKRAFDEFCDLWEKSLFVLLNRLNLI